MARRTSSSRPAYVRSTARSELGLVGEQSPLESVASTFRLLTRGPDPLLVDGRALGHGLPQRAVRLDELASILMHPSTSYEARDAVWRVLVDRARADGSGWVIGAVGCALPVLRLTARRLGGTWDAQAEVLAAFVDQVHHADVVPEKVCSRLSVAAHVQARAALREAAARESGVPAHAQGSLAPPQPFGHPDFVLARAVKRGVITAGQARLIGAIRLEDVTVTEHARHEGVSRWVVYKRLATAETQLVDAIRSGQLSDPDLEVVLEATLTTAPESKARRERP